MVQWCGDMGIAQWVGMIALWVGVIGLVIWAVTRLFPSQPGSHARAVLDHRLARGELDLDTYLAARDALTFGEPTQREAGPLQEA